MGKINKRFRKEQSESEAASVSEHEQEVTKRKADDGSDDEESRTPPKKTKKSNKKLPPQSNGKAKSKSKSNATNGEKADKESDEKLENGDDEEEYEVQDIVDHRVEGGKTVYLVRWKGYSEDENTWEPKKSLTKELIEKYEKKIQKTKPSNDKSQKKDDKKSPKGKEKKSSPADSSKEWEVERIIDYAEEKGVTLYRIRWKGYKAKNDTWEPRDNLFCDDLIEKFEKRMKTLENVSFKELREEPKTTKRLVNETALRTNITNKIGRTSKRSSAKKRVFYGDIDE